MEEGWHTLGAPEIVLEPNPDTGWEEDISRPNIVKREDGYHMWYTGWTANINSNGPVFVPDESTMWEQDKVAGSPGIPLEGLVLYRLHRLA